MTAMRMKVKRLQRGQTISLLAAFVLVLGMVLAVGPSVAQAQAANTWTVDATYPNNDNCNTTNLQCKTIQAAVTAAIDGDTINVAAGTYDEIVNISKSITLRGANAGIHPAVGAHATEAVGARGPETILSHSGPYALGPTANNITVDGFKFTGGGGQIIRSNVDANSFHLTNNIFTNPTKAVTQGVIQFGGGSHTDLLVDYNLFQDKGDSTLYFGGGPYDRLNVAYNKFNAEGDSFFWASTPLVDGVIEGNEFDGTIGGVPGVGYNTVNIGKAGNLQFINNHVHDVRYTALQVGIDSGAIQGNTFEDLVAYDATSGGYAIYLWGGAWGSQVSTNVDISQNVIRFNQDPLGPVHGIRLPANDPNPTPAIDGSTIYIHDNQFIDGGAYTPSVYAIRHQGNQATAVDASGNWWSPNAVTSSLFDGNVNYISWCTDAACSALDGPIKNVKQDTFHATIQAAINAANANDTIAVAAGTYTEEILVNKQVALRGANAGIAAGANPGARGSETIIDGGFRMTVSGAVIDGFVIQNGRTYGSHKNGVAVEASDITIANTIIEDVPGSQSNGIETVAGSNNLVLTNNTIRNNWRGIFLNSSSGHVFTGNYILANNGVGVGIGSDGLSNTTLTGNTFEGNTLEGWGAGTVGANVSAHFNVFDGTTNGIYHYGGQAIDATNNWWGNASGPNHPNNATPGTGAIAVGDVEFDPWLGAETSEVNSGTLLPSASSSLAGDEVVVRNTGANGLIVTIAKYTGNPSSVGTFGSSGSYYDVNVSGSGADDSLEITMDAGGSTGNLYYFNGTDWKSVVAYSDGSDSLSSVAPSTTNSGFYVFELNNTDTQPLLSDLTGTEFTGANSEIRLMPSVTTLAAGETLSVDVEATSLGLYGVDVSLAFNATNLEVTNVTLGGGLLADVVVVNTYNNDTGTLNFVFSQKADGTTEHDDNVTGTPAAPILLATITFSAEAPGTVPNNYLVDPAMSIATALFSNNNGDDTYPGIRDGSGNPVELTINPSPGVYVNVSLQGRNDFAGTYLKLSPLSGESGNVLFDNQDAAGLLEIADVPANSNSNPPSPKAYNVRLDAPKYLAAVQQVTVSPGDDSIDLTAVQLRGGDLNDDDQINIQDLVLIGVNFNGGSSSVANINGDSSVNIQDLAIAAGNFGAKTTDVGVYVDPWDNQ